MTNAEKKTNPSYRTAGSAVPGPDYVCSKCGAFGLRLWRQTNTFADHLELLCAPCAEVDQAKQVASYDFVRSHDPGIGDLVPARPTEEGDTFWGQTSGGAESVTWWYALPQYRDVYLELARVKIERDHFVAAHQADMARELKLYERVNELEREAVVQNRQRA